MRSTRLISDVADSSDRVTAPPMRLLTLLKLLATACVVAVMTFSGMLAYHVMVKPLGGVFSKIIPPPVKTSEGQSDTDLAKMLDSVEMPDIDPGEKTFQKAHELLALGKLPEAREKLTAIVNVFPSSSCAPVARRIVGEMNLDEILSADHMEGKQIHVVKRGDSFISIAAKYKTTLDCIIHLNSMVDPRGIHPGDELIVMPLEFHIIIDTGRNTLALLDGGRFICEYTILHRGAIGPLPLHAKITSKYAEVDSHRVQPSSKEYRTANKVVQTAKPPLPIRAWDGEGKPPAGILLRPQDMEEINLLTNVGNDLEIR